jgi:hypothetical protein
MSSEVTYVVNEQFSSQLKQPSNQPPTPVRRSFENMAKLVKDLGERSSSSIKLGEKSSSPSASTSTSFVKVEETATSDRLKRTTNTSPRPLDLSEIPGIVQVEEEEDGVASKREIRGTSRLRNSDSPKSINGAWVQKFVPSPRSKSSVSLNHLDDKNMNSLASEMWNAKKPKSPLTGSAVSLTTSEEAPQVLANHKTSSESQQQTPKEEMQPNVSANQLMASSSFKKDSMSTAGSKKEIQGSSGSRKDLTVTYTINESFSLNPRAGSEELTRSSMANMQKMIRVISGRGDVRRESSRLDVKESDFAPSAKNHGNAVHASPRQMESPRVSRKLISPRGKAGSSLADDVDKANKDDYLDFAVKKDKGAFNKIKDFFISRKLTE